jgi:5'-deoxynucleotidase YfbR-like HD superfamily hydrolase
MADSYFLFLERIEPLKTTRRRGWVIRGVPDPESVADHSHRVAIACRAAPGVQ